MKFTDNLSCVCLFCVYVFCCCMYACDQLIKREASVHLCVFVYLCVYIYIFYVCMRASVCVPVWLNVCV